MIPLLTESHSDFFCLISLCTWAKLYQNAIYPPLWFPDYLVCNR